VGGRWGRRLSRVGGAAIALVLALAVAPAAFAAPPNDDFASAFPLQVIDDHALTDQFQGSTAGATSEPGEPAHPGIFSHPNGTNSVWYAWTPGYNALARVYVCSHLLGLTSFDPALGTYTGSSVGSLTGHNLNYQTACQGVTEDDIFNQFTAIAGTTYYFAVAGSSGAEGYFMIRVYERAPNDQFDKATSLTGTSGQAQGNNTYSAYETGEPSHGGVQPTVSVWYRWVAPVSGRATFNTCGSDFNTSLAVYTGASVDALTPVADNRNATTCSPQSRLSFNATRNTVYRITVDGDAPYFQTGAVTLNWAEFRFPQTTITAGPSGTTTDSTPTFRFASSLTGSTFKCRFDAHAFGACSGPGARHTPTSPLASGPHTFAVRASKSGATDPTPATRSFTIAP
jgi:hypothetical protein